MTIKHNRVVGQGETFAYQAQHVDEDGTPVDLSDYTITLRVKKPGGAVVGTYAGLADSDGNVSVSVSDETTETWPVGKLSYLVTRESPEGDVRWSTYGALTVLSGDEV